MLKIGLTGGIGSGKSTVADLFADLGVPVVDADVIARQLVQPGQPALQQLVETFGGDILDAQGALNRAELRRRVFADAGLKQQLDALMHPLIFTEIENAVSRLQQAYCLIAIPLLTETGKRYSVDRVLVVDCSPALQLQRVLSRDKVDRAEAEAIIAAQARREQRLAIAHEVIDNSGPLANLAEQVKNLHNSYLFLASARTTSA